jgi:hypothetical protein
MRTTTVSALCALLSLICPPRPAVGQSNLSGTLLPPQILPAPAKPFELPGASETGNAPLRTYSAKEPTNPPQSWINLLAQQNKPSADQYRVELKERAKKEILPQLETAQCAHMLMFQAPNMDPKMIEEIPREFDSNMPTFEGLPACCRDSRTAMVFRDFHRVMPIPPSPPFVAPGRTRPASNLGMWLNHPRP